MKAIEQITNELAELYQQRELLKLDLWRIVRDIDEAELQATPPEGWQGKNDAERKLAQSRTFAKDPGIAVYRSREYDLRKEMADVEASIQANEIRFEGLKWSIRLGLVQALGKGDPFQAAEDHAMDAESFDDDGEILY
jgi:hypothetical protein